MHASLTAHCELQAEPVENWSVVQDLTNHRLLCIDGEGIIREISEQEEMNEVVQLGGATWCEKETNCVVLHDHLMAAVENEIRQVVPIWYLWLLKNVIYLWYFRP